MGNQKDQITWREGNVPVSTRFDDPFFSLQGGMAETRHVFLDGNDLPDRFLPGFHIGEVGFGTGLNALLSWQAWVASGQEGDLHFTSFEAFPLSLKDMTRAHGSFPDLDGQCDALQAAWQPAGGVMHLPGMVLNVIVGDARDTLPIWQDLADAWFLDGFSPAKNPELWGAELLAEVGRHTRAGGTCATYTAAGLCDAGCRRPGSPCPALLALAANGI